MATTPPLARFQEPPCPLCGSEDRKPVLRADDWFFGLGRDFQVVRCGACGFHFTCPRPTEEAIGSFYPEHYWEGPASPGAPASRAGGLNWKGRLLWSAVRAAERLSAAVLPGLHQHSLVGPISCSFLARPGTAWPPALKGAPGAGPGLRAA